MNMQLIITVDLRVSCPVHFDTFGGAELVVSILKRRFPSDVKSTEEAQLLLNLPTTADT